MMDNEKYLHGGIIGAISVLAAATPVFDMAEDVFVGVSHSSRP
jgi:hypothetical protein